MQINAKQTNWRSCCRLPHQLPWIRKDGKDMVNKCDNLRSIFNSLALDYNCSLIYENISHHSFYSLLPRSSSNRNLFKSSSAVVAVTSRRAFVAFRIISREVSFLHLNSALVHHLLFLVTRKLIKVYHLSTSLHSVRFPSLSQQQQSNGGLIMFRWKSKT